MESRHVSIWIEAEPEAVYEFAADPQTWPRWAAGLAEGGLRQSADGWVADSPMGQVTVEFAPPNSFGVLDHVVRLPSGEAVYNPLRVIPGGVGESRCEVLFTVRRSRLQPAAGDPRWRRRPRLRGAVHGATTSKHDGHGVRCRCRGGGRRPRSFATPAGELAARRVERAQDEPHYGARGRGGQH